MTPAEFRLAQLQHALAVAASVPDPADPAVQDYLSHLVSGEPDSHAQVADHQEKT